MIKLCSGSLITHILRLTPLLYLSWMKRPHDLKPCDISIFRSDIQPFWEDEANKSGGTWIVRIKRQFVSKTWELMVLAMLGELKVFI